MLLSRRCTSRALFLGQHGSRSALSRYYTGQTNPPLNLDPSLQAFLNTEEMSLPGKTRQAKVMKELEVIDNEEQPNLTDIATPEEEDYEHTLERKSPAAYYGSQQIGAVVLPNQLQNAISVMISGMSICLRFKLISLRIT